MGQCCSVLQGRDSAVSRRLSHPGRRLAANLRLPPFQPYTNQTICGLTPHSRWIQTMPVCELYRVANNLNLIQIPCQAEQASMRLVRDRDSSRTRVAVSPALYEF